MQELWLLLMEKAPPDSLQPACSQATVADMFTVAATIEGQAIDWSHSSSMEAVTKLYRLSSQKLDSSQVEGAERWVQMRFDTAEALASLALAWPSGRAIGNCFHSLLVAL